MKWRMSPAFILAGIIAAIVLVDVCADFASSEDTIGTAVVCNGSVSVRSLSRADIQEIFLGRKTRWDDGQKIVLATLKKGRVHEVFMELYVGKTPRQFLNHWDRLVFTGKGRAPHAFATPQELIEFVHGTPGAIGYVPCDADQQKVKDIAIQ